MLFVFGVDHDNYATRLWSKSIAHIDELKYRPAFRGLARKGGGGESERHATGRATSRKGAQTAKMTMVPQNRVPELESPLLNGSLSI